MRPKLAKCAPYPNLRRVEMSYLVVQGSHLTAAVIANLTSIAEATSGRSLNPSAWCGEVAERRAEVGEFCRSHQLDFAFFDRPLRLTDFRLLAMDMDSTLITIECIDELADYAGVKSQVAAITAAAMRGELDFPAALRRRVRLLAGLPETALQRVYDERLRLSPGAETLLAAARNGGLKTLLVSGGFTFFTRRLAQRLSLDFTLANELEIQDGKLTGEVLRSIVDAQAKAAKLTAVCAELGASTSEAIALGDGANDLKMMGLAGLGVAYRAKLVVQQQATVALNFCGLDGILNWFETSDSRPRKSPEGN